MIKKINILAVDDRRENLLAIEAILSDDGIRLYLADSGQQALALMLEIEFAVVLLDVMMPDMDGFETAELIRGNELTCLTPIIFITAISKEKQNVFKGYESGAVDYIFKPFEPEILRSKVRIFLELYRQKTLLKQNAEALRAANREMLVQQREKIEKERAKVLLQMAGATAHEIRQPLMALLGSIELIRTKLKNDACANNCAKHFDRIDSAGRRIADVVQKIQLIQQDRVKDHDVATSIIDIHQNINVLYIEDEDGDFRMVQRLLSHKNFDIERAATIKDAIEKLNSSVFQLVLLDFDLPDGNGFDFMKRMTAAGWDLPVIVITGMDDVSLATQMIQRGAYGYLTKADTNSESLVRAFYTALEKAALKGDVLAARRQMTNLATMNVEKPNVPNVF